MAEGIPAGTVSTVSSGTAPPCKDLSQNPSTKDVSLQTTFMIWEWRIWTIALLPKVWEEKVADIRGFTLM